MSHPSRAEERALVGLSPFELKARLLAVAAATAGRNGTELLDAGRGNPNWIATTPRAAFFLLGRFALDESARVWVEADLAGMPAREGIAARFEQYLQEHAAVEGAELLQRSVDYGASLGFDRDEFVYELADGIIGDHYPGPDRICVHAERILREYLARELCQGEPPDGIWQLFAVEGGTAAICYLFDSLATNFLLRPGDKIALMVPEFTPYLELPRLDRYGLDIVELRACAVDQNDDPTWQFPATEIDKLADPAVRAMFVVNPSNPPSVMLASETLAHIRSVVEQHNPDLIVVTDDVYGTFVPGFVSLMDVIPSNTVAVYSFSKYFGATGWRLGVVAIHENNVLDRRLAGLPAPELAELDRRYDSISTATAEIPFIDRMVADSRQVALNHTAGLSLPQQVQMTLFAAFVLLDNDDSYKLRTRSIVNQRLTNLYEGMHLELPADPLRAGYYAEIDLMSWARRRHGREFASWLGAEHEPVDPLFRLAEEHGVVLLNGGGFDDSAWSVRVSLANLTDDAYLRVGASLRSVFEQYAAEWQGGRFRANRLGTDDTLTAVGARPERGTTMTATEPSVPPPPATSELTLEPPVAVAAVAPEKATGMVPLDQAAIPGLDAKVSEYVDAVTALDVHSPAFAAKAGDVRSMGDDDIRAAADTSNHLLNAPVRAMQKGPLSEGSKVGATLFELRRTIEKLDPKGAKGVHKLLGLIPFGDKIDDYFKSYESAQKQLDAILNALYDGQDELRKDNAALEQEKLNLWETMQRLEQYIYIAEHLDESLTAKIAEIDATDPEKAKALRDDVLFYVRQKHQDLLTQMAVSIQGYLAIDLVRKNNIELVKGVDRATTTTMAALRTAVIVAQALTNQKLVLDQITALNTTTSGLIQSTSELLKTQSVDIQKQAASATIGMDALKTAFANIYQSMDAIDTYKVQALDAMSATVASLKVEIDKSQAYLNRVRASEVREAGSGNDVLKLGDPPTA